MKVQTILLDGLMLMVMAFLLVILAIVIKGL